MPSRLLTGRCAKSSRPAATSPMMMPSSSCCGWVSSPSRTGARPSGPARPAGRRNSGPPRTSAGPAGSRTGRCSRRAAARGGDAMTRPPVTLADQGVFIEPDDADELTDLLTDAAWVIGHLASDPAAEDACARAPGRPASCAELALDLRLAAAGLDEAATAGQDSTSLTALPGKSRKGDPPRGKRPRHATEKKLSGEGK